MAQVNTDKSVYSPQQVSSLAVKVIEERHEHKGEGIRTGITCVDKVLNPHRPGELRVVLGYTSNYKTGLMNYIARHNAREAQKANKPGVVISITWEQSIEEQGIVDIAQLGGLDVTRMVRGELNESEWVSMKRAAVNRGVLPWWAVGHSSEGGERRPRLTMTNVAQALEYIVDVQKVQPILITLDYLQRIAREGNGEPRMQFMEIVDRAKDMALAFHTPVMLGSQAKREVKERSWRLPQPQDGQETSNLEQSADSILSVWMPKNDYAPGEAVHFGGAEFNVNDNLLILGVMKQKFGRAPVIYGLHVEPQKNEIYEVRP